MGYFVNAVNMFGLPERAAEFQLNFTETQGPYRLWNTDEFDHPWGSTWPLYAAVPYIVGHAATQTASVAWLNSAETFVDLFHYTNS
jgi:alpha-glucosidase (family GH31 glycosyl hydrolase)